jgi:hypothetical protein
MDRGLGADRLQELWQSHCEMDTIDQR